MSKTVTNYFPELTSRFTRGRYQGMTIGSILKNHPGYLQFCRDKAGWVYSNAINSKLDEIYKTQS